MADGSHIEWTDATWNPVTGCSVVSPGCTNCYAMKLAGTRMKHHWSRTGLTQDTKAGPVWTGEVRFNEEWLDQPLRWKRPRRIFVCAHGDLFAEGVPDEWIDKVFAVMALAPQHTFQILTKRAERMRDYLSSQNRASFDDRIWDKVNDWPDHAPDCASGVPPWPFNNCWLGVSVEDQARADERIPLLLDTPAAKRFISAEPLLGPVDLLLRPVAGGDWDALRGREYHSGASIYADSANALKAKHAGLDWVIVGGESGPNARPMHPDWARSLRDQCQAAGVAYFFKQNGEYASVSELAGPGEHYHFPDGATVRRVGKKAAGRLLDGREWSEFPA